MLFHIPSPWAPKGQVPKAPVLFPNACPWISVPGIRFHDVCSPSLRQLLSGMFRSPKSPGNRGRTGEMKAGDELVFGGKAMSLDLPESHQDFGGKGLPCEQDPSGPSQFHPIWKWPLSPPHRQEAVLQADWVQRLA